MNRRRMMMLQQNKGYELFYSSSSGALPPTSEWEQRKMGGYPSAQFKDGYLVLQNGSSSDRFALVPAQRNIAETNNIKINATVKLKDRYNPAFTLIATNGIKAAWFAIFIYGTPTADAVWSIRVINDAGKTVVATTKQIDVINNFVKIELVFSGDTYTGYINDEEVYTAPTVNYELFSSKYNNNMILNNSESWGRWLISEMSYKEW